MNNLGHSMGQKFQPPIDLSPVSEKKTRWVMALSMLSLLPMMYHCIIIHFFPIEFMPYDHRQSFHRCPILSHHFWVNYNDLTATSLESWLVRGIIPKLPYFRLVKYYKL